jgi:hypothetical protein
MALENKGEHRYSEELVKQEGEYFSKFLNRHLGRTAVIRVDNPEDYVASRTIIHAYGVRNEDRRIHPIDEHIIQTAVLKLLSLDNTIFYANWQQAKVFLRESDKTHPEFKD